MSYQALYRKYRSQRFDQMVGQEVVSTTLKNAVINNQISHAYLFSGPRGTGKTSAAKIFAKAINCPNQVDGEPCNECFICESISKGNLDDVIELDAASNNGVDEIREIRDKSTYAPSVAKYKIYIIDEVHMLSTGAFNALLKTLEEPTENVVFILATTELQKIPATILSRVQRFEFKSITTPAIEKHLAEVLDDEAVEYDEEALDVIAKSAEGGMRDALSTLDQALSLSDGKVTLEDALLVTGSISSQAMDAYVSAILNFDTDNALAELDVLFDQGKNMLRFTEDLMFALRDLLLRDDLEVDKNLIFDWIDIASDSMQTLKSSAQTKIIADVMTIKMTNTRPSQVQTGASVVEIPANVESEIANLRDQVRELEKMINNASLNMVSTDSNGNNSNNGSSVKTSAYYSRERVFKVLGEATNEDRLSMINAWDELVAHFTRPSEQALLNNTSPVAASKNFVVVTFGHENLARKIMSNKTLLAQVGNHLSNIIGMSPEMIALSENDWQELRSEYVANRKKQARVGGDEQSTETSSESSDNVLVDDTSNNDSEMLEFKNLLADKIIEIED